MGSGGVYVLSGVSGSGKSTISDYLTATYPKVRRAITVTTRMPREGERYAYHYYFVDPERFQWLVDTHQLLEYTVVYTQDMYGTLLLSVEQMRQQGSDVLFVVDTYGVQQIKAAMPEAKVVFLAAPNETEQRARLERRGTVGEEQDARV